MALTTTSLLDAATSFVVNQTLLRNARFRCPYFEGTMPGEIMKHSNTFSMKWRRIDNLTPTTTALSELSSYSFGAGRTPTSLGDSNPTASLLKYGDFVVLTEETIILNVASLADKTAEVLGIQAGRSLNRLQRNIGEDNVTLVRPGEATTDSAVSTAISNDLIASVVNTLDRNGAIRHRPEMLTGSTIYGSSPVRDCYVGICHSDVEWDIRALTTFIAAEKYATTTGLFNGEFGSANGVRWISTPEASVDGGGGVAGAMRETTTAGVCDLYTALVYGVDAIGSVSLDVNLIKSTYESGDRVPGIMLITKGFGSAGVSDPFDEYMSMAWKAWHGGAVLNSDWARGIRVASRKLS